jgi:plastocyanin
MTAGGALRASVAASLRTALALAVVAVLAGCTGEAAIASPVATTQVDLPKSYRFAPEAIVVQVGDTVTWTNSDDFTHNVAFEGDEPLPLPRGASATRTFDAAGTFPYLCSLHPKDMQGTVIVGRG